MNLSDVLDRSRQLVRSRGLEPAFAAVQAVDELAEGLYESIDEERLIAAANLELSGFGVIQPFLDDPSVISPFCRGRRWAGSAKTGMPRQSSIGL